MTLPPTVLSSTTVILNGRVNPGGLQTIAWFEWGATTNYGGSTTTTNLGSGTNVCLMSFNLSGLSPASTYHYRMVARTSTSTNFGGDIAFTTLPLPSLEIAEVAYRPGEGCRLQGNGLAGGSGVVEVSTNLVHWVTLTNFVSDASGWFEIIDCNATNCPTRFYRLRWP